MTGAHFGNNRRGDFLYGLMWVVLAIAAFLTALPFLVLIYRA